MNRKVSFKIAEVILKENKFSKSENLIYIENIPKSTLKNEFEQILEQQQIEFHVFKYKFEDKTKGSIQLFSNEKICETIEKINQIKMKNEFLKAKEITKEERKFFMNRKLKKKREKLSLKDVKYVYSIDFELGCLGDATIPLEIGCVKLNMNTLKIEKSFHEFINPGKIDDKYQFTCRYTEKNIHGIPFNEMKKLTKKSVEQIWKNFEKFLLKGICKEEILMLAKGPYAENASIKWMEEKLKRKINLNVFDVKDFLFSFAPELTEEKIEEILKYHVNYLNDSKICHFHKNIQFQFHCALEDAFSNILFLQEGIKNNFKFEKEEILSEEEEIEEKMTKTIDLKEWTKNGEQNFFE